MNRGANGCFANGRIQEQGQARFMKRKQTRFSTIYPRLDYPSEALTICRIGQATLRASAAAGHFVKPDKSRVDDPECVVRAADCAALVHRDAEPRYILFGPGLDGLWRPASQEKANLWTGVSAPVSVSELLRTATHERRTIEALLDAGAIEFISAK